MIVLIYYAIMIIYMLVVMLSIRKQFTVENDYVIRETTNKPQTKLNKN